ncbi:MAG: VanZ family protein [Lutibacter sp.]
MKVNFYRKIAFLVTIAVALVSFWPIKATVHLSYIPIDKIAHFLMYLGLNFIWLISFKNKANNYLILKISLIILLYGIIIEVCQSEFTTYRSGDIFDVLANFSGIIVASLLFKRQL